MSEPTQEPTLADLVKIIEHAEAHDIKLKRILVPRVILNSVRLMMLAHGLDPRDFYDPEIEGRNLRFYDNLLVEDLGITEIMAASVYFDFEAIGGLVTAVVCIENIALYRIV
jgi:hypothetical protein